MVDIVALIDPERKRATGKIDREGGREGGEVVGMKEGRKEEGCVDMRLMENTVQWR